MKHFDTLGIMIDCSRNAVMTIPRLKKLIALLVKMGCNHVQLYTEDTYEVDKEPYFGYFRGQYTQAELKELDDYAFNLGGRVGAVYSDAGSFKRHLPLGRI